MCVCSFGWVEQALDEVSHLILLDETVVVLVDRGVGLIELGLIVAVGRG